MTLRPWAETVDTRRARKKSVPVIDLRRVTPQSLRWVPEADTLAEEPPPKMPLPEGVKAVRLHPPQVPRGQPVC